MRRPNCWATSGWMPTHPGCRAMRPSDQPRMIALNGAAFRYATAGEQNGETIVVLHGGRGIGDHSGDFKAFLPLADRYRLLAYDQRGCGLSSLTPPYSFEQFADDLEAFRVELCGGRRIVLIGGSFGGMIPLTYAVKYGSKAPPSFDPPGTAPDHPPEPEAVHN